MQFLNSWRYPTLYRLWAAMFALTAVLGVCFPAAEGFGRAVLVILSAGFFIPPWMILLKSRQDGADLHRKRIRLIALAALVLATAMICLSILAANGSDGLNTALHIAVAILTAPMVCSNYYVLPLFLWATLLVSSLTASRR